VRDENHVRLAGEGGGAFFARHQMIVYRHLAPIQLVGSFGRGRVSIHLSRGS
jgi:hypothetical protein